MDTTSMYDDFVTLYDNFVDWPSRLRNELPLLKALGIGEAGQRIVDTACGTGHHARAWSDVGAEVIAYDASAEMIARAKMLDTGNSVDWRTGTFFDVMPGLSADALVCLGTSLPHVESKGEYEKALRCFHDAMTPGGLLVVHSRNLFATLHSGERYLKPLVRSGPDGTVLFWRFYDLIPPAHLGFNLAVFSESGDEWLHRVFASTLCVISADELAQAAQLAGFSDIKIAGHLDGRCFEPLESPDMVLIARA